MQHTAQSQLLVSRSPHTVSRSLRIFSVPALLNRLLTAASRWLESPDQTSPYVHYFSIGEATRRRFDPPIEERFTR